MKRTHKRLLFWAGCAAALPALLLFVLVVGTRPFVIQRVVLPLVSKRLEAPVRVDGLAIAPFSRIEARDFQVGAGEKPFLRGRLARVRYRLAAAMI